MNSFPANSAVDVYIGQCPVAAQPYLQQIRQIIQQSLPTAQEIMSYGMPAYKTHEVLVYFAGYAQHIGFYPTAAGINHFSHLFDGYIWSKGAIQFPLHKPLPKKLIRDICKYRLQTVNQKHTSNHPFHILSAPAQRALQNAGITQLKQLSKFSQSQIVLLHGMGPSSIQKIEALLQAANLHFKQAK